MVDLHLLWQALAPIVQDKHCVVAYSGGVDSHVLLDCLVCLRQKLKYTEQPLQLSAIHVNHQIHEQAEVWADHCQQVCHDYHVPLQVLSVDIKSSPVFKQQGTEAAARDCRYRAIAEALPDDAILLLAQHADDQAETLLLQMLRGAGIKGLSAMASTALHYGMQLHRPLNHTQDTIMAYATSQCLNWVDDPSNCNRAYDRNYLRHEVMPILRKRWPEAAGLIARSANHCAEAQSVISELITPISRSAIQKDGRLDLRCLENQSYALQKAVLFEWFAFHRMLSPSTKIIDQILDQCVHSRADSSPLISWHKYQVRRYREHLYCLSSDFMSKLKVPSPFKPWSAGGCQDVRFTLGQLQVRWCEQGGMSPQMLPQVYLHCRRGGEQLATIEHRATPSLKNLWQKAGVPPWYRNYMPLLTLADEVVVVPGLYHADKVFDPSGGYQFEFSVDHK